MNKTRLLINVAMLAALCGTASSCYIRISDEAKQELKSRFEYEKSMNETVYGSSDTLSYSPGAFNRIEESGSVDMRIIQREGEPLVLVSGTTRARDSIRVENIDGTLKISYRDGGKGIFFMNDTFATVYVPSLEGLSTQGSGDIVFDGPFKGEMLDIHSLGSGDITINDCRISGLLKLSSSGSGDHVIKGKAGSADLSMVGSGDMDATGLEAGTIRVTSRGSGDISYRKNGKIVRN